MPRNRHKTPEQKTLEVLKKHLKGGETLICGVSGGPDSVFLLHCLLEFSKEIPIKIVPAHINHTLRGEKAEEDARFVENLAQTHALPFECTKVDTTALAKTISSSIEEAGREIRYEFFFKLFEKYKASYVLTAHHSDDNLETILLNFTRGSNLKGLCGMQETSIKKNGLKILRPLLCTSKQEIKDFLEKNAIPFRIDHTNFDTKIPRNFFRLEIIPRLKTLNPNLQNTILKNCQNFRDIQNYITFRAEKWIAKNDISSTHQNLTKFNLKPIQKLPPALQREILTLIYKKREGHTKNISAIHLDEVLNLINKNIGRKQKRLGKYTVEIKKGTFILNSSLCLKKPQQKRTETVSPI